MSKMRFVRYGEKPTAYQCTKKTCKWEGPFDQQVKVRKRRSCDSEYVCPKCGHNEFYGIVENID
ncbi:hypothetical protein [Flavobacterium sp. TAB 87]|uniref:hypothetical protein n=1 Tax=Flavobacterium sp. TAB 87 TaxID=1729581 RepID=UPI00076D00E5|nr:hypothetical protein [Flavobacterium sp. TAB 87]KVV14834.1 hypothetical protein AP058_01890 [Flavobacterium sp. TAB 87]